MTWRIYPQFKDALRVDGRLTTVADYLDDSCGQKLGPAAISCLAEERARAQVLLGREQGKSILLVTGPLFGYLLLYLPWRLLADRLGRRRATALENAA
jgi:MFS family permease